MKKIRVLFICFLTLLMVGCMEEDNTPIIDDNNEIRALAESNTMAVIKAAELAYMEAVLDGNHSNPMIFQAKDLDVDPKPAGGVVIMTVVDNEVVVEGKDIVFEYFSCIYKSNEVLCEEM